MSRPNTFRDVKGIHSRPTVSRSIHLLEGGWVVVCPCGWKSAPKTERVNAEKTRGRHVALCPLGKGRMQ
jgi:hypothetical protein